MKKPTQPVRRKNKPAAAIPGPTPPPPPQAETLQQERNLFRAILDNLPSIVFCKDKDGRYVLSNRAHQRVLGATEEAILGKTAVDFHPPGLARQYLEEELQIMRTGKPLPPKEELALHHGKGEQRWHLTSRIPLKDKSGHVTGVLGISHDITERKRTEDALQQSRQLLQTVVEGTSDAVYLKDLSGRYLLFNGAASRYVGKTAAEVIGHDDTFIFPLDEARVVMEGDRKVMAGSKITTFEEHVTTADGTKRIFHSTKGPMFDANGGVIGLFGVARDITERKQAEEELLRRTKELAALNSLTEGVSSSLSLEIVVASALRELLNAVKTDVAFLFLREGERLVLGGIAPESGRERFGQIPEHRVGECMCGLAVRQGRPLYSRDIFSDLRCTWEECKKAGYHSFAALPLHAGDEIIGVVGLASAIERDFEQQAGFLETLANAISASLQNARLFAETKRAEAVLRESEARYRTLFDKNADGILIANIETKAFKYANPTMCRMLGYTEEELRTKGVSDIHPKEAVPGVVAEFEAQACGDKILVTDIPCLKKDGSVVYADISAVKMTVDGRPCNVGFFRDITERRLAREKLRLRESFLSAITENQPGLLWLKDTKGRFLMVNKAFATACGRSDPEHVHGLTDVDIWPKELAEKYRNDDQRVMSSGNASMVEEMIFIGNSHVWYETFKTPVRDDKGRVIGTTGFARDITERKQAEEALQASQARFRTLIERAPVAINISRTGKTVYINKKFLDLYGFQSIDELVGQSVTDHCAPEFRERLQERAERRARGEPVPSEYEGIGLRKDGSQFPVQVSVALVDLPDGPAAMAFLTDITERRQAEERIREQAALLDAANDAIYVRTLDNKVTYWNDAAERLHGWTRAEALGHKITELGKTDAAAFEAAQETLMEQGYWSGELKTASKTGREFVVFCRWTMLRDEQGRPKEILAINTDITERKQLEANFLRAQRMEGIGALAGGIAHDLNNILQPILITAPLLRETTADPESRSLLDTVEKSAQRGADIIKQLLTFARGTPGVRVPLPVRHLMSDMDKIIRETFPRNIKLVVDAPNDLWPVMGDATQIHQALMNLCVNARDAMPNSGVLTLAAKNLTLDETFATAMPEAKPGTYICVSVTDTGTGILPEHLDRIFDPFFTTKEIGKGTGLGLATVLGIVRGHGGFVRVNSKVDHGTTFELYLPASPKEKTVEKTDTEALPPAMHGELILIVDDEAAVRGVIQRTLDKHGYRVVTANEGSEAMAFFAQHRGEIKAVITDLMMPGMDGPALIRALRHLDPQLPILSMTGMGEQTDIKGIQNLGLPVLLKPFVRGELLAALHQALAAPRQAKSNP